MTTAEAMSTEVKICGLTNLEDSRAALEYGADYLGFVLYGKSPRSISARKLGEIAAELPADTQTIGVFVNEKRDFIESVARDCGLYAVQLHGDETRKDFEAMEVPLWRALRLRGNDWHPRPREWPAARYVADAVVPGIYGGTGVTADWRKASELAAEFPVVLAGGLNPDNVAEAVRKVRPQAVDVASGVEARPGKKDLNMVRSFIRNAQACERKDSDTHETGAR
ncbi:MAG: phosphoribosylanthranilate isomerase [Kiritimatiellia bacterium]